MDIIREFIIRIKKICEQLFPAFDGPNDCETVVESILKESRDTTDIQVKGKEEEMFVNPPAPLSPEPEANNNVPASEIDAGDMRINKKEEKPFESVDVQTVEQLIRTGEEDIPPQIVVTGRQHVTETTSSDEFNEDQDYKHVIRLLAELLKDLEQLASKNEDSNVEAIIEFCENRIEEILLSSGCKSISNEQTFDNTRHVTKPFEIVLNGKAVEKTVKSGIEYKGIILRKAIVKLVPDNIR